MNYKEHVEELKNKCELFLQQVAEVGNECAWTDRAVETILASAKSLHQVYYGKTYVEQASVGNYNGAKPLDESISLAESEKSKTSVGNKATQELDRDF